MTELLERRSEYENIQHVDELVDAIDSKNCTPGWVARPQPLMWPSAPSRFVPAHWSYAELRPALQAAGRVISTELAERRNFVLRNPVPGNDFATTRTLVGAYQSILPGEKARSHRHSSHALRVIIESRGSYSIVNGKQHPMESGDIVLTPGNHWHGHGHAGNEQAYWFDCLDLPLVHLLEPMNYEEHPQGWESDVEEVQESSMRLTWQDTQAKLAKAHADDDHFGKTIDRTSDLMRTITIKVHAWDTGWTNKAYRQNANQIFVVLQGSGVSHIASSRFEWSFGDVFVAPLGARVAHSIDKDAVVVALSDEGLMKYSGYYTLHECE